MVMMGEAKRKDGNVGWVKRSETHHLQNVGSDWFRLVPIGHFGHVHGASSASRIASAISFMATGFIIYP